MRDSFHSLRIRGPVLALALFAAVLASAQTASAQLRIVTWNTATAKTSSPTVFTARAGTETVLKAIGEELINGIQRPIDILLLQEQFSLAVTTDSFADILNNLYGTPEDPTPYKVSAISGFTSAPDGEAGRPAMVWNSRTVDRPDEGAFGVVNGSNQPRSTLFYQFRPLGEDKEEVYGTGADFFAYNSHYKAGTTADDKNRRNIEATSIRQNVSDLAMGLGFEPHALYVGDYNVQSSSEDSYQTMLDSGVGQAHDPLEAPGNWNLNPSFAAIHTQAPCASSCSLGLTGGGMDDRFDFQLMTGEFLDGEGLSYIGPTSDGLESTVHSYRAFGNGGVSYDTNINNADNGDLSDGDGYPFNGLTSYTHADVLNALRTAGDHIPVVADYQLPAILSALADSVPATLNQGEDFDLDVTVWNSAPVAVAIGADELDYVLSATGDLAGDVPAGMDLALGGMNMHPVAFDTSTPGMKSGTITVMSSSQMVGSGPGVVGGVWTLNVMYEVLASAGLVGDYNGNDIIDAADYTVWRDALTAGSSSLLNDPTPGVVDETDFDYWRNNFGTAMGSGAGSATAVPEPSTFMMLLWAVCLARLAGGKLGSWTRRS